MEKTDENEVFVLTNSKQDADKTIYKLKTTSKNVQNM